MARGVHASEVTLPTQSIFLHGNDLMSSIASNRLFFTTLAFALIGACPSSSSAATTVPERLYAAANDYRAAVVHFERVVKSGPGHSAGRRTDCGQV